jgi:uncharacterized protein YceK
MKKIFCLLLLPILLAGCTSITNLTPSQYPRDPNGYYRVEAEWKSNRETIVPYSFQPLVVIGFDTFPMRPVPVVQDRWEAFIPVPAARDFVLYRYKFDYMVNAISRPHPDSLMSPEYTLKIVEKK